MQKRKWLTMARHKWLPNTSITELCCQNDSRYRRFVATIHGHNGIFIYEGQAPGGEFIKRRVEAIKKMMEFTKIAVGVGYCFNIFSPEEVTHIDLKRDGAIIWKGVTYPFYSATSFEESKKVDSLLDEKGDLRYTKDNKIKN